MSEIMDRPPGETPGTVARGRQRLPEVPVGFRPAPSDDELETNILERWQGIGLIFTIFLALFLPAYWLFFEPQRATNAGIMQRKESIERGGEIYAEAPEEVEAGAHVGFNAGCAQCHGANAQGGIQRKWIPPGGKEQVAYQAPSLNDVFVRQMASPPDGLGKTPRDAYNFVYETIVEGRPLTPMPAWALSNGGPLNDQQIGDVMNFLISLQDETKFPKGVDLAAGAHEGSFSRLLAFAGQQR
jgi:mono/diheme cytochrome c family protein